MAYKGPLPHRGAYTANAAAAYSAYKLSSLRHSL